MNLEEYNKIFIPGWAIATSEYKNFVENLSISYLRNIEVANFGYFNEISSENELNLSLDDAAQQVSDYVGDNETILFCHSLGSVFGLQASLLNENIKTVVVFSGFGKFAEDKDDWKLGQSVRALRAMKMMLRKNPERLLEDFYANCAQPFKNKFDIPVEFNGDLLKNGLELLQIVDIRDILATIQVPVLFIHGDKDVICDCNVAETTTKMMTKSKFAKFSKIVNSGHNLLFDNVDQWQGIISEFFEQIK